MSKNHNYNNYQNYSKKYEPVETFIEEPVKEVVETVEPEAVTEEKIVEEVVETVEAEIITPAVVSKNCSHLNVRQAPNATAKVECVIKTGTELMVDEAASTGDFYKIYLASGIEGFCMKQFVNLK